jgi:polar amino acid transport system permease protein
MTMSEPAMTKFEVGDSAALPNPNDEGLVSAWWIALIGAIASPVLLPWIKPHLYLSILRFFPDGINRILAPAPADEH